MHNSVNSGRILTKFAAVVEDGVKIIYPWFAIKTKLKLNFNSINLIKM